MDLIIGLPKHNGKDTILTIVDHGCLQAAVFLPCTTTIIGLGIAQLYMDHVYKWFGLPDKVISDHNPRFTSHFGKSLAQQLRIDQNLSSAFHPQIDEISERKNQWVKQYLQLVTSTSLEDWTHWLTIVMAVHNNWQNETTGLLPNQILLGYELTLHPKESTLSNNEAMETRVQNVIRKREQAINAINQTAREKQTLMS
jgi:hypothetical protein